MFKILAKINKVVLPSMIGKDLSKITTPQKLLIAYRYWVTKNAL